MLAPDEFTVGTLGDAKPLSLMLPRTSYERPALVGRIGEKPVSVFLAGEYAFHYFECAGNDAWKGLIVPNVRVEVDVTSVFEANYNSPLGSVVRTGTTLGVRGKQAQYFDNGATVVLHDDLISAGEHKAGFSTWHVVIGEGQEKRVLWTSSDKQKAE